MEMFNNKVIAIDAHELEMLATSMDYEKKEKICDGFAPCSPEKFLNEYLKIDPDFIEVILSLVEVTIHGWYDRLDWSIGRTGYLFAW